MMPQYFKAAPVTIFSAAPEFGLDLLWIIALSILIALCPLAAFAEEESIVDSQGWRWTTAAPRDEIKPQFSYSQSGGPEHQDDVLTILSDGNPGIDGAWIATVPVNEDTTYRFFSKRKADGVPAPHRSAPVKISWLNKEGRLVQRTPDKAQPEYRMDRSTDAAGWTTVSDRYHVPTGVTQAKIELHLRWTAEGKVDWSQISLRPVDPPMGESSAWPPFISVHAVVRFRWTSAGCSIR